MSLEWATGFGFQSNKEFDLNAPGGVGSFHTSPVPAGGRYSMQGGGSADGPLTRSLTARAEYYFSLYWLANSGLSDETIMEFGDGATTQFSLRATSGNRFRFVHGDGTTLATGTFLVTVGVFHLLDVRLLIANVGGRLVLRVNDQTPGSGGSLDMDFTGDTQQSANAQIDRFRIPQGGNRYVSDLVVNNTLGAVNNSFVGPHKVRPMLVTGAGDVTQLTAVGSATNWQNVDDYPPDDATSYNKSATIGQYDIYALEDPPNIGSVAGILEKLKGQKNDAGAGSFKFVLKETTEARTAAATLAQSWRHDHNVRETNPRTGVAWTAADLANLQEGFEAA